MQMGSAREQGGGIGQGTPGWAGVFTTSSAGCPGPSQEGKNAPPFLAGLRAVAEEEFWFPSIRDCFPLPVCSSFQMVLSPHEEPGIFQERHSGSWGQPACLHLSPATKVPLCLQYPCK